MVYTLPDAVRAPIIQSYNDALTPLFLYMVPLAIAAAVLLSFVQEKPLATVIDRDSPPEDGDTASEERKAGATQRNPRA